MLAPGDASAELVKVNGVSLEVKRFEGTCPHLPTLIFLHEGLGCVDMWRDFPDKLVQLTGCPALVYSRQGYGRSDSCLLPRTTHYMHGEASEVLPKLIHALGIRGHVLVGHSNGASIALIYAGSETASGLEGVVSMSPHVHCERLTVETIREAKSAFRDEDLRSRLAKYHFENVDCAFWGWCDAWLDPDFAFWNIEEFLPRIEVPQLVLQGTDDPYGTMAHAWAIKDRAQGSVDLHALDGCGHSPFKDQEEKSLDAIQAFVRRLTQ